MVEDKEEGKKERMICPAEGKSGQMEQMMVVQ
jgi:hypothetical protein